MLRVFFLAGKFSGFDAAVALAGDGDRERGVLEAVAYRIGDHGVDNDLGPVIEGQLSGEDRGFPDGSFLENFAQILRLDR